MHKITIITIVSNYIVFLVTSRDPNIIDVMGQETSPFGCRWRAIGIPIAAHDRKPRLIIAMFKLPAAAKQRCFVRKTPGSGRTNETETENLKTVKD